MPTKINEIKKVLEKIRPYIQRDGGDVEFVSFQDGIVSVRMLGACKDCIAVDDTIKDGIEAILQEEIEGVTKVIQVDDDK